MEYVPLERAGEVKRGLRGIYVLYRYRRSRRSGVSGRYDVVYVGMARTGGIRFRLRRHKKSKVDLWTHFSVFEVCPNVRDEEVRELEGLFRHLYKLDSAANKLNKQRGYKPIRKIRVRDVSELTY